MRKFTLLLIVSLISTSVWSQRQTPAASNSRTQKASTSIDWEEDEGIPFTPTISLGAGMITYYGEISRKYKSNNPIGNRLGYRLKVAQPINSFLNVSFNLWRGKIAANERSLDRNLNFESTLTSGGIAIEYNFGNFYKKKPTMQPYVSVGFEAMEFLSKTDLVDEYGNDYYYWDDGSIRNIPENAPNADDAIEIQRDYKYETDIRELNADGFGDYDENTFALPLGAGLRLHLNDHVKFDFGATYYFTFTDYIDGVTNKSSGARKGDRQNDQLLFTHVSLSYDFARDIRKKVSIKDGVDLSIIEKSDNDSDGVADFIDRCAGTPVGVPVDEFGCPFDSDNDEVSNYKDDEPNSAPGALVDSSGVTYTDERLTEIYNAYRDSIGTYSKIEQESFSTEISGQRTKRKRPKASKQYMVKVGEFEHGIPADMVNSILNLPDVQISQVGDKVIVSVGSYDNLPDAMKRKLELESKGVNSSAIITKDFKGNVRNLDGSIVKYDENNWPYGDNVSYRVQLGAFTKAANEKVFKDVPNMLAIQGEDGFMRYYTGTYNSYKEAAAVKIDMVELGFSDAYVVALKGGSKISLSQAGATVIPATERKVSNAERQNLKFKVQIGTFKEQVPTNMLEKFMELDQVEQKVGDDGVTRYVVGNAANYEEAEKIKQSLINKGFTGAFIVGEYEGKIIPAKTALKMIN